MDAIHGLAENRQLRVDLQNRRRGVVDGRYFEQLCIQAVVRDPEDIAFSIVAVPQPSAEVVSEGIENLIQFRPVNVRRGVGEPDAVVVRPMYSNSEITIPDGNLLRKY